MKVGYVAVGEGCDQIQVGTIRRRLYPPGRPGLTM